MSWAYIQTNALSCSVFIWAQKHIFTVLFFSISSFLLTFLMCSFFNSKILLLLHILSFLFSLINISRLFWSSNNNINTLSNRAITYNYIKSWLHISIQYIIYLYYIHIQSSADRILLFTILKLSVRSFNHNNILRCVSVLTFLVFVGVCVRACVFAAVF